MRLSTALLVFLPVLFSACGGGSSDPGELTSTGNKALGSGDFEAAQRDFDAALTAIGEDASHPDYLRAKMGAITARTKDAPDEAVSMFLALAKKLPDRIQDRDYNLIGGRLGDANNFDQAIKLVQAGQDAYPDSPHLDKLVQRLGDQAKSAGSSDALATLRGLGYVGD